MNEDIKIEYMHLCDYASPGVDNKVNIIGIFDSFLKTTASNFFIATRISAKVKAEYKILFEIKSEDDKQTIFTAPAPIIIPESAPTLNFNLLASMNNIDFKTPGKFKVLINVNGKYFGEGLAFEVKGN